MRASGKIKFNILLAAIVGLLIAMYWGFSALSFVFIFKMSKSSELFAFYLIAGYTILIFAINLTGALWLLIGKSRIAAVLLMIYQIFNLGISIYRDFHFFNMFLGICAGTICFFGVLGTFKLEKEYQCFLFQTRKDSCDKNCNDATCNPIVS